MHDKSYSRNRIYKKSTSDARKTFQNSEIGFQQAVNPPTIGYPSTHLFGNLLPKIANSVYTARWSSGLRLRPLTPATAVRIRYGSPIRH